ncbi:MAG: ThiF family adenylyltransferase [Anaerolineae bacterium]|nr:ThiF family adenylyltransferase [Anaerolineae bacterium]
MPDIFHHETLYRGARALEQLGKVHLTVCGAGAVGSNLALHLARQGVQNLRVIDFDRVEAHNIGTQSYTSDDVGMAKVEALQAEVFRAVGVEIEGVRKELTQANAGKLLAGTDVVVDGFDNHAARAAVTEHCRAASLPCLHVGLNADYAEILWNETYRVPQDVVAAGANVCEYPLARALILFAVALAGESLVRYMLEKRCENYSFTLRDLQINRES